MTKKDFDTWLTPEVVRMTKEQGLSIVHVSQSMDIGQTAIRHWVKVTMFANSVPHPRARAAAVTMPGDFRSTLPKGERHLPGRKPDDGRTAIFA